MTRVMTLMKCVMTLLPLMTRVMTLMMCVMTLLPLMTRVMTLMMCVMTLLASNDTCHDVDDVRHDVVACAWKSRNCNVVIKRLIVMWLISVSCLGISTGLSRLMTSLNCLVASLLILSCLVFMLCAVMLCGSVSSRCFVQWNVLKCVWRHWSVYTGWSVFEGTGQCIQGAA